MCGICGVLNLRDGPAPARDVLARMAGALVHRGPDDEGYHLDGPLGLGVRRLSIVDVAGGRQPACDEHGDHWLVLNGEIYNHAAVRHALESLGHAFRSRGDTETLVHAFEQWGLDALPRLNGMFACAWWDARAQRLVLVRDRLGVKPLFYAESRGRLLFASEVKALLAEGSLAVQVDREALGALLEVGFVPGPGTFFAGVRQVPAGHVLVAERGRLDVRPWWALRLADEAAIGRRPLDERAAIEQFQALLRDAVDLRRADEVPMGALVSGGIDSAAVVANLRGLQDAPVDTFSIGFAEPRYDETARAQATAAALGTRHHALAFGDEDFARYPDVLRHLETPQCAATALPIDRLYAACHAAGFKVILTGEGADELLGGYHWHRGEARARPLLRLPRAVRGALAGWAPMSPGARAVLREGDRGDPAGRLALWLRVAAPADAARVLAAPAAPWAAGAWRAAYGARAATLPPLHDLLHVEAHTRLPDFINFEVDRLSMAHSVEARAPFLDYRLWEFCAALPPEFKLRDGREKYVLREALRDRLPAPVLARPKQGLAAPYACWLAQPRLPEFAEEALSPASVRAAGCFVPAEVARLRAAQRSGRGRSAALLMGVLSVQVWHAVFARGA
jgi:asparagine synthase (glutamine-hydrolysing)